ncbi:MAG: GNAT family N-acetyltransferase [Aliishimia sp.]
MTDTTIRRATAQDGAACAGIIHAWLGGLDWMTQTPSHSDLVVALSEGLPMREAYVIGDPVQGYLSMEANISHIWGLYTSTQGQGLGKALMDRAKQGRNFVQLNTHVPNTRAHAFYEREGFVKVGDPWRGNDDVDEIRMEWRA